MNNLFLTSAIALMLPCCQEPPVLSTNEAATAPVCRIMFWNPENLFDCYNDTLKLDDEYLPHGLRGWSTARYSLKIKNMYKVIIAAGDWEPPDMIGLCEVENKNVLFDLVRNTQFSYYDYRFIHHESPDRRGIDVAILYNPATVEVLSEKAINVFFPDDPGSHTRDILYARVKIKSGDTLSVFVNHWPSKFGGAGATEGLRKAVSVLLIQNIRELSVKSPFEKIIVIGDFNDPPESSSMETLCNFRVNSEQDEISSLVNLGKDYQAKIPGSYKFQGSWELIDQVLVSPNLLNSENSLYTNSGGFRVFSPAFLLETDERYGGMKPFRTYSGFDYIGGFSDHLPVILDLFGVNQ